MSNPLPSPEQARQAVAQAQRRSEEARHAVDAVGRRLRDVRDQVQALEALSHRLRAEFDVRKAENERAQKSYAQAVARLQELRQIHRATFRPYSLLYPPVPGR